MKKITFILVCILLGIFSTSYANPVTVKSPDGKLELKFEVVNGIPQYSLNREGKPVVKPSKMGFTLEYEIQLFRRDMGTSVGRRGSNPQPLQRNACNT